MKMQKQLPKYFREAFLCAMLLGVTDAMSLEQPDYKVIYQEAGIEIRRYEPYLVTETVIEGEATYKAAAKEGFKRLFSYISGNNSSQLKIDMTKPVQQTKESEKIDMTAPVQYTRGYGEYSVSFVLPRKYSLDTAPVPLDKRVRTVEIPERNMAVVSYSGRWTNSNFNRYKQKLLEGLKVLGVEPAGEVQSAFYNAPFVLPFLRHNEVMVEVGEVGGKGGVGELVRF